MKEKMIIATSVAILVFGIIMALQLGGATDTIEEQQRELIELRETVEYYSSQDYREAVLEEMLEEQQDSTECCPD